MDLPHDIYYRNLPHWQPPGAIMFVTARTAGSLPRAVEEKFRRDAKTLKENLRNLPCDAPELINAWKKLFQYADENMESYRLAPYLERDEAAATVVASIHKGAELGHYILHRYCVMSNHIHLLIEPLPYETDHQLLKDLPPCWPPLFYTDSGRDLLCQGRRPEDLKWQRVAKIMGVMKGATSRKIRKAGTIEGAVWRDESYDHWVRNGTEYDNIIRYIDYNPVKAGMCAEPADFRWGSAHDLAQRVEGGGR